MPSKYLLGEQILYRLNAGQPDQASRFDIRDIMQAVGQAVNERAGGSYLNVTLPSGETIPEGSMLLTFEDVPVVDWKNRSRVVLPIVPVSIMRGIGVYEITDPDNPDIVYIPAMAGQFHMVADQKMLNKALPNFMYAQYGINIEFSDFIPSKTVLCRLVGSDATSLGIHDTLPMPADWEAGIVDTVYKRFALPGVHDEKSDAITQNVAR